MTDPDGYRLLECPTCGCTRTDLSPIGATFCGPHQVKDGEFLPAVQMREVRDDEA